MPEDEAGVCASDRAAACTALLVAQWCFDEEGRGFSALTINTPPPRDRRCLPAFFDLSACGGECIPATSYLGCHTVGDDCVP